ncbi:NAD(P)H-dependent oxidoreductase, partial [Burkholderia sp.]
MKVLIVHAHPEPQSFCTALKTTAVDVLRDAGHEVEVSDLYAMG